MHVPAPSPADPAAARRRVAVTLASASIDVIVEGTGPAVVLLPSSLRDSQDFDDLAARIAREGLQVLRPQPRGMGRSSPPPAGMTLETLADDVAGVIAQLAAGPAVVVGHAYGHWVARMTDLRHPQRVRGVVVLGAAARQFPPGMADALAIASDPQRTDEARLEALRVCMFAPGNDPSAWLAGWHPQWRAAYREASQHPPREAWYGQAHAPLLDLQGAQDAWRPPATRGELRDALGEKVTVKVIERAGHALVPEQPEAVARAIVDWVRGLDRVR
ncbi:alpha/beta fold hydrolase [Ramlibacter sp. MAHUQ-53]|uniref:alpha/beta fold hydrolase n=1 Tax=unclassified Ramlibacter TaxID=2617605 RepID=UPI0036399792